MPKNDQNNESVPHSDQGSSKIKEEFQKHQKEKRDELEKIRRRKKLAESNGLGREFQAGMSFDGLEE